MAISWTPGYCPASITDYDVVKAENALVDKCSEYIPEITADKLHCGGLDTFKKCVDLLIGLVVNYPGYRKPAIPTTNPLKGGAA